MTSTNADASSPNLSVHTREGRTIPTVTFVIPAYNVENYIGRAVQSLLDQTVAPHEILVVNDGSTDATPAVIRRTASNSARGHLVRLLDQPNQGVSGALNTGLDAATGDYIVILGGDDWVDESLVERVLPSLSDEPDIAHWRLQHVDEAGACLSTFDNWTKSWPTDGWSTLAGLLDGTHQWLVMGGASAWRRQFLDEQGIRFHPGCATAEDKEFIWTALMASQRVAFVDASLAWYLLREGSVTKAADLRRIDGCMAYLRVADRVRKSGHLDGERLAQILVDESVSRYFVVMGEAVTPANVWTILAQVEARTPGLTRQIQKCLRERRERHYPLSKTQLIFCLLPAALPFAEIARKHMRQVLGHLRQM